MLSKAQEKRILATHTKKGREKTGLVLLEGEDMIKEAGQAVECLFSEKDSNRFSELVTTQSPQMKAALARLPSWSIQDVSKQSTIIILDGVQDPGNVGTILRSALGFNGGIILCASTDIGNPKVIRSSAGAIFHVPWIVWSKEETLQWLNRCERPVYRLERKPNASSLTTLSQTPIVAIAGSEGQGITLEIQAPSITIPHHAKLESLNVAVAVSLFLYERSRSLNISA